MSERDLRKKGIPVHRRANGPPHPPLSPSASTSPANRRGSSRHQVTQKHRRYSRPATRPIEIFERWSSEPNLLGAGGELGQQCLTPLEEAEGVLYRPQTCENIFSSSDYVSLTGSCKKSLEPYNKDAKVVINVTVEGSPGPVRMLVKLGSSVEEIIKLVVNKYCEEGRTPHIDKDAASTFELHDSYFSLQCLNKAEMIGDAGRRSFYLRTNSSGRSSNASLNSDSVTDGALAHHFCSPLILLQSSICRKINKIIRSTHKVWKILGCIR